MTRTISNFCLVWLLVFAFSSNSFAVQQSVGPVFPRYLQNALADDSMPIGSGVDRNSIQSNRNQQQTSPKPTPTQAARSNSVLIQAPSINSPSQPEKYSMLEPIDVQPVPTRVAENTNSGLDRNATTNVPVVSGSSAGLLQLNQAENEASSDGAEWFGTVMSFSDKNAEPAAEIIVHEPLSAGTNEFSFIVENTGTLASDSFTVEFITPENVKVLQVFPFTAKTNRNSVIVKYSGLAAGEQFPVHIKTTSASGGTFAFETRVRMEKSHVLEVQTDETSPPVEPTNSVASSQRSDGPYQLAATRISAASDRMDLNLPASNDTTNNSKISDAALTTSFSGSEAMVQGHESQFEIVIGNQTDQWVNEIVVQLNLPNGLMITKLDRQAWIDQKSRTVSWKVDSIAARSSETIQYRAKALLASDQTQSVIVGMNNTFQSDAELKSSVFTIDQLKSAPQPNFEE